MLVVMVEFVMRVAPLAGAWIETSVGASRYSTGRVAPLAGVWISPHYMSDNTDIHNRELLIGCGIPALHTPTAAGRFRRDSESGYFERSAFFANSLRRRGYRAHGSAEGLRDEGR